MPNTAAPAVTAIEHLHLPVTKRQGLVALGLFTVQVLYSQWWLQRFRFGPAEWLWRSITYWKLQPMRRIAA